MEASNFVGKIDVITTQYGEIIKFKLGPNDFKALEEAKNDSGWVVVDIKEGKKGKYAQINTYKAKGDAPQGGNRVAPAAPQVQDDFPF
jgi:hypothetical protein